MTTENVVVLFTDMVGSTALASAVEPDIADEDRRHHLSVLRQAIAESGGTEVKALGDGLMVVFPIASAALSCGVGMQQGIERDNRTNGRSIGLRVGLSGGEATREDEDYFGDPVIEAARLCAKALGGQILASEMVPLMAGRRSRHSCRSLGAMLLKGLPEAVATCEVIWEPLAPINSSVAFPLPNRLAVRPTVGIIGREPETERILDATKRVAAGSREIVLISGEAGIGKTTLAADAARAAFAHGALVLFGHCEEDLALPYQLFVEALNHYVVHAPEDQLRLYIERHGSELSRLAPALGRRFPDLPLRAADSEPERFVLFASVVELFSQLAQEQSIVLVFDDLQWADRGSLLLLSHLVSSDKVEHLLVLGSYRDSELSQAHALVETVAALRRQGDLARIELSGLEDSGVVAYMEAAAGHTLDDESIGLAHTLYRETDGNPYFVGEVLRHLVETGAIVQNEDGRWVAKGSVDEIALPDSVREVIGARVLRLGKDAGRILSTAAVIGRDFDLELLAQATSTGQDTLLDTLDAAVAAALVREVADATGSYSFAHSLIQHTLYEDLGATRRALLHQQIAEALESLCKDRPDFRIGELARHWTSAIQPIDLERAINYSRLAGDAALDARAPANALGYYQQAQQLCFQAPNLDQRLRIDVAIGLGTAQRQTGDPTYRDTLLDAARDASELGDVARLVRAALANNRGFGVLGSIDQEKVAVLEAALAALPKSDSTERSLLMATMCDELSYGSLERRVELADAAMEMASRLGDAITEVRVATLIQHPLNVPAQHRRRESAGSLALDLIQTLGSDPVLEYWATSFAHMSAVQGGRFAEANGHFVAMKELSDRIRQPTLVWTTAFREAGLAIHAGDPERAEGLATRALEIGTESGQSDAFAFYGTQLGVIRFQQGRLGELCSLVADIAAANPGIAGYQAGLAEAYLANGQRDEALHLLNIAAADRFTNLHPDIAWMDGAGIYARLAIEFEAVDAASLLYELLFPYANQIPFQGIMGQEPVAYFLGALATTLGRFEEADAFLIRAADICARGQMAFAGGWTRFARGHLLLARGEPTVWTEARALLEEARDAACLHGYGYLALRSETELAQLT